MPEALEPRTRTAINHLIQHYQNHVEHYTKFLNGLVDHLQSSSLKPYTHSIRWRLKDPKSLKAKLEGKARDHQKARTNFPINEGNLFRKINDLAGCRLIHLYRPQFVHIRKELTALFETYKYEVLEGPSARTWDDESRAYFNSIGVKIEPPKRDRPPSFYTSVHYVIAANTEFGFTAEIQVRTLAEELWGAVDHQINYKKRTKDPSCLEQIAVLGRVTSGCARLVDSIFATHEAALKKDRSRSRKRT